METQITESESPLVTGRRCEKPAHDTGSFFEGSNGTH